VLSVFNFISTGRCLKIGRPVTIQNKPVQQNENKFQKVWVHCIICENINPNNNECWTLGMIPSQVSINLNLSIYDRIMTNKINETENFG
jgi:hypothetical protein